MLIRTSPVITRALLLLVGAALLALAPSAQAGRAAPDTAAPRLDRSIVARPAGGVGPAAVTSAVSAGGYHTCGLKGDGHILCWGFNGSNQAPPTLPVTFTQISAGDSHTCGLKGDGTAMCWGLDSKGQSTPPPDTLKLISAGLEHTCGLKTDNTVLCWGNGEGGRTAQQAGTFVDVSAGGLHTCALKSDLTALCWGHNDVGQTTVLSGTFTQISAGGYHTCGLRSNGTVECWGRGNEGQKTVAPGTYSQISAGAFHTCGLKTNGTIACWGSNSDMQSIAPGGNFTQVSAGGYHSCAVDSSGGFRCWGRNTNRQAESRFKPVITTQPSPPQLSLTANDSLTLEITASGAPTPTLQWRKDSAPLPNQTSRTLHIAHVRLDDAGSYDVVVSNSMGSTTSSAVVVTVARLTQTISFDQPADKRYGNPPFDLSAIATSGLPVTFSVVAGTAKIDGNEMTITAAGIVVVRASQAGNGIYNPAPPIDVPIDIARAKLTVKADDHVRFFGEPNPPLTVSYIGLVNDDTEASIDTKPQPNTLASSGSPIGDYPIFVGSASDANYDITTIDGTLHIVARLFYLPIVTREVPSGLE